MAGEGSAAGATPVKGDAEEPAGPPWGGAAKDDGAPGGIACAGSLADENSPPPGASELGTVSRVGAAPKGEASELAGIPKGEADEGCSPLPCGLEEGEVGGPPAAEGKLANGEASFLGSSGTAPVGVSVEPATANGEEAASASGEPAWNGD